MVNLKIEPVDGYTKQIGLLLCEMSLVRKGTIYLTEKLSQETLDCYVDDKSNSIGTLLLHIAALELRFQTQYLHNREMSTLEKEKFHFALPGNMIHRKIKNHSIDFYFNELSTIRQSTIDELGKLNDEWLYHTVDKYAPQYQVNHFYLLRHLLDDEIAHQGQIKWILKRV